MLVTRLCSFPLRLGEKRGGGKVATPGGPPGGPQIDPGALEGAARAVSSASTGISTGSEPSPPLFCCIRAEHGVQKRCFSASLKLKPSSRRLQHRRDVCNTMKMKRLDRSWPVLTAIGMPVSPVFCLCLLPILITIERCRRTRFRAQRP